MKLFIWSESLDNGAYHEDGSAIVAAENKEAAIALLKARDEGKGEYVSYHYAAPAERTEPSFVLDLAESEIERIVALEIGCDC